MAEDGQDGSLRAENERLRTLVAEQQAQGRQWAEERAALEARAEQATEELRVAKALLLLNNMDIDVGLSAARNISDGVGRAEVASVAPRRTVIRGDPALVSELLELRAKLKLLRHTCLVLRAEATYLKQAVPETTEWVFRAARDALENEVKQRKNLQGRLDKLVKLFN